jgi:hypothetical protein
VLVLQVKPNWRMKRKTLTRILSALALSVSAASWNPEDEHPCNIKRVSFHELYQLFGSKGVRPLYPEPLILLRNESRNQHFFKMTSRHEIVNFLGEDLPITLSSSNSLSEHRRTTSLKEYIDDTVQRQVTLPDQNSNETWYLFGETYTPGTFFVVGQKETEPI